MNLSVYHKKAVENNYMSENKSNDQIEDIFWRNAAFSPPLYGADIKDTFFDKGVLWNMNDLNSVLSYGIQKIISGVNIPYCYIGCWKTMFAWHKEDLDLSSINYLHHGKSKFWYAI